MHTKEETLLVFLIITIKENRGFTNGYKVGLAQINTEIFCLLSSDVEVNEGWIEPVLEMFEERKKLAIVQPKIKSWQIFLKKMLKLLQIF